MIKIDTNAHLKRQGIGIYRFDTKIINTINTIPEYLLERRLHFSLDPDFWMWISDKIIYKREIM